MRNKDCFLSLVSEVEHQMAAHELKRINDILFDENHQARYELYGFDEDTETDYRLFVDECLYDNQCLMLGLTQIGHWKSENALHMLQVTDNQLAAFQLS